MIDKNGKKTRSIFLWTRLSSTPFYVLFTLLPYILYKDAHATLFQVTTLIILKPAVSLAAPYLSVWIEHRPSKLISNLTWASALKFFPFLFIPWIDQIEYFTLASIIYLFLGRGVTPAWMEILKLNLAGESRSKAFAYGQAFDYLGIALFPLLFGSILDAQPEAWRWLFFSTALVGIFSSLLLLLIPQKQVSSAKLVPQTLSFSEPWRQSWNLLKERPDFTRFQIGFMLGGSGLMVLHPALPVFFNETLNLSYKEMAFAIAFCKGIGYAAATPFWAKLFNKIDIFRFCGWVTILAALFPLVLIMASNQMLFLWIAFLGYGIMQAGSELSWHLSGPVFSKDTNSAAFSQTNILAQGVRGAFTPYLGMFICQAFSAEAALILGSVFCLLGTWRMLSAASFTTNLDTLKTP